MARIHRFTAGAVVALATLIVSADGAHAAGPLLTWLGFGDDPPPTYNPARFWAPGAAKVHDHLFAPRISVVPPDRHPEVPPTFTTKSFPTSIAMPREVINKRPTAPASSPAR